MKQLLLITALLFMGQVGFGQIKWVKMNDNTIGLSEIVELDQFTADEISEKVDYWVKEIVPFEDIATHTINNTTTSLIYGGIMLERVIPVPVDTKFKLIVQAKDNRYRIVLRDIRYVINTNTYTADEFYLKYKRKGKDKGLPYSYVNGTGKLASLLSESLKNYINNPINQDDW